MSEDVVEFVNESEVRAAVAAVFDGVCLELARLLPGVTIEHVGSTSVLETVTKGDLDVCVLVDQTDFIAADGVLSERFARNVGSDQSESLSSFVDRSHRVPVGIQLVASGGAEDIFVRWRDLLRASPPLRDAYNALKRRWHGRSHGEYRLAKSEFIERTLASPLWERPAARPTPRASAGAAKEREGTVWIRIGSFPVKTDQITNLRHAYNDLAVPRVRAFPGNRGCLLLEPASGDEPFMVMTIWKDRAAADAYESSGAAAEVVSLVRGFFAGPPTLRSYKSASTEGLPSR